MVLAAPSPIVRRVEDAVSANRDLTALLVMWGPHSSEVRRHRAVLDRVLYRDELTQTASIL
jgi:hypothetical protein